MDTRTFFGSTLECACGKTHAVLPRRVLVADDALHRLPALCAEVTTGRRVVVLMDARTREVAGTAIADALGGDWQVRRIVVPDPPGGTPVCAASTSGQLRMW